MPAASRLTAKTGIEIDRATNTIRLRREFEAGTDAIFEAWTDPEQVACWWDPAGQPLQRCEIDLRVGGNFIFVSKDHPDRPFSGTYLEIAPPGRLVFEAIGATGRVMLESTGGGTRMIVEITCRSAQQLDEYLKMGVDVGTAQTLDNLVTYAGRREATVP